MPNIPYPYTPRGTDYDGQIAYNVWHLSQIISPYGADYNSITFQYTSELLVNHSLTEQQHKLFAADRDTLYLPVNNPPIHNPNPRTSASLSITRKKRLQKISWAYGSVDFLAEEDRPDLYYYTEPPNSEYAKALSTIIVRGPSGSELKHFDFTYGRFAKTELPCAGSAPAWIQAHRERLQLLSVSETGGGISLPPYTFSYNPTPLPPRHSAEQDYWGYYNGNGATNLLSQVYAYPEDDPTYYRSMYSVQQRLSYTGPEYWTCNKKVDKKLSTKRLLDDLIKVVQIRWVLNS